MRAENPGLDPTAVQTRHLARKVMLALKKIARWEPNGQAWYVCGHAFMNEDGSVAIPGLGWNAYPAPIVLPLLTYWQATGDDEALEFARAYADGVLAGAQPDGVKFEADGNFVAHSHATLHGLMGYAKLGNVTGEKKYVDFAKRVWDRFLRKGTGTGWYPATLPSHRTGETCCVADVVEIALEIAMAGHPEYFDFADRDMRNRIVPAQFILTPEFEAFYREKHKSVGEEKLKEGLRKLKTLEGGFHSDVGVNKVEEGFSNKPDKHSPMYGCCVPEGMRATYMIWRDTIVRLPASALGPEGVYVNMSFNRDSKWGKVVSFMPREGRLTVKAAVKDTFFLRPPHWAPRDQVNAFVNSKPAAVTWSGAHVRLEAQPGDELTLTYPLIAFKYNIADELQKKYEPDDRFTFTWRGNMVADVDPKANGTVLFTGKPRVLPPAPGEGAK